ncbi:carbohydrate kinase [Staphylococcus simiae]|uniref:carbohydrate kinase family protein n=1 Tax=Staphylococcus simiae TaxID=308354 RepID=UPI001A95BD95|nr:carbohydrate kinase [Staphylococcus simiae]MBO1198322.1 carbohydrate kinase [Staphylococcus simiae]MBO1200386.1 carbohydrate kinase [Staphylococcus simiae]MBO1202659.1 carbohydrate kinase [Staphylococcus simiae]MBO1210314.1 carbohydrate kinase [Staphylococcus simiae]MBO1228767.1 carbohydrate kinase [Staphylococcus simiae]
MRRLYAIGEALIDFIPNTTNVKLKDVATFSRQVGGAPCNVACAVQKLGQQAYMITQLGNDAFGDRIIETIADIGVNVSYIKRTDEANTALAFVSLAEDGQRDFSFYRKPSADMLYHEDNIEELQLTSQDIMHFCSVDLVESPMKQAHHAMIDNMLTAKGTVVFDPNVRLPLWDDPEDCRRAILEFIPYAHIVKVSDEELEFITGIKDEDEAIQSLFKGNVEVVIYTKGKDGAVAYLKDGQTISHEGFKVTAVDTTGAGDAFIGAVISKLLASNTKDLTTLFENEGQEILAFSNKVAAKVTTEYGAIDSLPTLEEVIN